MNSPISALFPLWTFLAVLTAQAALPGEKYPPEFRSETNDYFPPPGSQGGWRKPEKPEEVRRVAGMDPDKLAEPKQWLLDSDKRDFESYLRCDTDQGTCGVTRRKNRRPPVARTSVSTTRLVPRAGILTRLIQPAGATPSLA